MMSKSRLVPWLGFGVDAGRGVPCCGTGARPACRPTRRRRRRTPQSAVAAGVDPTRLIVDFRDDVSAETLANNGFDRDPDQRLLGGRTACTASSSRTRPRPPRRWPGCPTIPSVESVDYESFASDPARRGRPGARRSARRRRHGGRMRGGAPGSSFPNDACYKYQWHMRQIGMPDAWKRGNGKGVDRRGHRHRRHQGGRPRRDQVRARLQLRREQRPTPTTTTATARTSPGPSRSRPTTSVGVAGVAYGATIMPLKVLSARGSGSVAGIAQAIRWAADHGANVINMSLGGPTRDGQHGAAP